MEIYFVRHGQTDGNLSKRHQIDHTELTFTGREQARAVAKKIKKLGPTHLVTSSLVRAIETAQEIGDACDLIPEVSGHFVEIIRPKGMVGMHHFSWRSLWFYLQWYFELGVTKKIGGESYQAFRERFEVAKKFLAHYPENARVVVVSHGVFISFFLLHICDSRWSHPLRIVRSLRGILGMPNTAVIKVIFNPTAGDGQCPWTVDR